MFDFLVTAVSADCRTPSADKVVKSESAIALDPCLIYDI